MKTIHVYALAGLLSLAGAAQQPPTLSTADRIAIQDCEQKKQSAQKDFNDAQQAELSVEREWQTAHPGWRIDQTTFAITADPKPTKPEAPKEPKKP